MKELTRYLSIGSLAGLCAVPVYALDELEEIVVTAQFKEQNLQDTPVAITAMSADMMENRSMTDISQVAAASPSVTMTQAGSAFGNATVAFIRGIGQYDSNIALEAGVGMYIDDVYHPTLLGSMFDLLDLERVEVLRGPQGTLAGKNSIGGAVKLYSRKPDGTGGGYVEATVGEFNRIDLRAAGEATLIEDTLFARVSGVSKQRDGYIDRVDFACANPAVAAGYGLLPSNNSTGCKVGTEGGKDVTAVRAALRWLPSDDLEINFTADTTEDNSEAPGTVLSYVGPFTSITSDFLPPDIYTSYATYSHASTGFNPAPTAEASLSGYSMNINWTLAENLALTSITSYRELDALHVQEDATPLEVQLISYTTRTETLTQELRLSGVAFNDAFDWTVGAYYFDSDQNQGGRKELPAFFLYFLDDDDQDAKSQSVFAHGIWALTDKLNVSAGIRYTEDDKTYTFTRLSPDGSAHPFLSSLDGVSYDYSGDETDYRLAVDYRWNDTFMTYFQYSTGHKGGGVGTRSYFPWQVIGFDPETLDAYEVGFKSDLLDNTLRLNVSAFLNKYEDIQLTLTSCDYLAPAGTPPGSPCAVLANAGSGDVRGLELEAEWYPVDNLMVDFSASWLDFEYNYVDPATVVNAETDTLPFSPEKQASLGLQYNFILASNGSITPRLDVNYHSEFATNTINAPTNEVEAITLVNARVSWQSVSEDWKVSLAVTNLTDEAYFSNHLDLSAQAGVGIVGSVPSRPREWSLSVKRNF